MFQNICTHSILFVQVFRWPKKGPLLIYTFRPLRDSKEPKTKENKNQFLRGFFWKILFLYFLLHKSCIWRTLGHVMDIFLIAIFILSKECFWPKTVKKTDFLKKLLQELIGSYQFLEGLECWIRRGSFFWPSKNLYRKCVHLRSLK